MCVDIYIYIWLYDTRKSTETRLFNPKVGTRLNGKWVKKILFRSLAVLFSIHIHTFRKLYWLLCAVCCDWNTSFLVSVFTKSCPYVSFSTAKFSFWKFFHIYWQLNVTKWKTQIQSLKCYLFEMLHVNNEICEEQ